jgi:NCS1 family nucleobase:cation symporter-1
MTDMLGPFASIGMLALALGSIGGNAMNVYSGGLTALVSGIKINRLASAVVIGIIGTIIAVWAKEGFVAKYEVYLLLIVYTIPALDAIFLTDFFLVRKKKHSLDSFYGKDIPLINGAGLISYLIGVGISIPMMSSGLYTGPIARYLHGADISYVVSMIVAGLCYWAIKKMTAKQSQLRIEPVNIAK